MRRLAFAAAVLVVLSAAPVASAETVSFDQPGVWSWRAPGGVHFATFELHGARGGRGGGGGAYVRATLAVKPRRTLTIVVGGRGGEPAGGFNGGGDGGLGSPATSYGGITFAGSGGSGGGGATDVRTGPGDASGLDSRLLVAGGGGGAAEWPGGAGGAPGQDAPDGRVYAPICAAVPPCPTAPGGAGGTETAAGPGGGFGFGGDGGDGGPVVIGTSPVLHVRIGDGGGGGGGGWYGGGSGASGFVQVAAALSFQYDVDSTGGGGGSSYVTPAALCPPTLRTGGADAGLAVITFTRHVPRRRACG